MYPSPFDYLAPRSLEEALAVLGERGDEAKALAGGQSLIPLLKLRFAAPELILDLGHIPGLDTLAEDDGWLRVGPLVRHRDAERSALLRQRYPTMAAAAPQVSDPLVRNLGTICGSLAHADPSGDWGSVMIAMGAQLVARSRAGERTIAALDFFSGPFTTNLQPGELLVEARVPSRPRSGGAYLKLERKVGDFATAAVAVRLTLSDDHHIAEVGIGLTAVGPTNLAATAAEEALVGAEPGDEVFREAAELAARAASPSADQRGSVDYKRHVVRVFTERGLRAAADSAAA